MTLLNRYVRPAALSRRGLAAVLAVGSLALTGPATALAASSAPGDYPSTPTLSVAPKGSHGFPFLSDAQVAAAHGYAEQEYLLSGTATAYNPVGKQGADGNWKVTPGQKAGYRTRILVERPSDPAKFNGTVIVEWFNVSGTIDVSTDWNYAREQLMREGYAYVGVSAQQISVENSVIEPGLKKWDPQRYGTLHHPGDQYSYDIFSQVAQALRKPVGATPLAGLNPKALIAVGESQSAMRLTTYVNAIAPLQHPYQGYLLHSNGLMSAPVGTGLSGVTSARVRTDLGQPVFLLKTETDVSFDPTSLQPDSAGVHTWQIAGTSHADKTLVDNSTAQMRRMYPGVNVPDIERWCEQSGAPINDGPDTQAVDAAFTAVQRWVREGRTPPAGAPLEVSGGKIVRDPATGLARGGIRLPDVAVPTRTLTGERASTGLSGLLCGLFGASDPWNGDTDTWDTHKNTDPSDPKGSGVREPALRTLYPTHAAYVDKVRAAAAESQRQGFLTPADAAAAVAAAEVRPVP